MQLAKFGIGDAENENPTPDKEGGEGGRKKGKAATIINLDHAQQWRKTSKQNKLTPMGVNL